MWKERQMTTEWTVHRMIARVLCFVSSMTVLIFMLTLLQNRVGPDAFAALFPNDGTVWAAPALPTPEQDADKPGQTPGGQSQGSATSALESGKEIVAAKCMDCHALTMVQSAHHTKKGWQGVVATMVGRGARLTAEEIPVAVQYLSEHFGVPSTGANGTPGEASSGKSKSGAGFDISQVANRGTITGVVKADQGEVRGFRVTSHNLRYKIWYVVFTKEGHYTIPQALPGPYEISVLQEGYDSPVHTINLSAGQGQTVDFEVKRRAPDTSITYLDYDELYPPGPGRDLLEKNCTECHGGDFFAMQHRTEAGWRAGVNVMTYGPSFHDAPVLGRTQLSAAEKNLIVKYLADNFGATSANRQLSHDPYLTDEGALSKAIYVEYDAPDMAFPDNSKQIMDDAAIVLGGNRHILHDPCIAPDGKIWLTASVASELVQLDPLELNPAARWKQFPIDAPDSPGGVYPHGLTLDRQGHVYWAESMGGRVGELDPTTGKTKRYRLPTEGSLLQVVTDHHDNIWYGQIQGSSLGKVDAESRQVSQWGTPTVDSSPYGMVVDQTGNIWTSSFAKGLVIKFDPVAEIFTEYTPPTPYGGARRIGVDSKGVVWFSQYRLGQIGSLNPATGEMKEYRLPMRYTHAYETWPDQDDNIWVTDHFNDSIIKFEQSTKKFTYYPLPQLKWSVPKIQVEKNNTIWFGSRGVPNVVAVHFYPEGYSPATPPEP
jgi:virginiamycin B lyase